MKSIQNFIILDNQQLNEKSHLLIVTPQNSAPLPKIEPGQFVQIQIENCSSVYLRRPISINYVDYQKNQLWLLIQSVGAGTENLCEKKSGDILNIIYPLGRGFSFSPKPDKKYLLIGGGVGTAPLLFLGKKMRDCGIVPNFLLGGRSVDHIVQKKDFRQLGNLYMTTEDGSDGEKGFVTTHSILRDMKFDKIFTCGPDPMMKSVARFASANSIPCEVSLENLMACGFGACLCCVEKTVKGNICTCTEGPVFNIEELLWEKE